MSSSHNCPYLWVSCINIFCVWGMACLLVLVYLWLLQCDTCFNWIHLHLAGSLFSSGFLAKWFRVSCIILNQQVKTTYKKVNVLYCITSIIFFSKHPLDHQTDSFFCIRCYHNILANIICCNWELRKRKHCFSYCSDM